MLRSITVGVLVSCLVLSGCEKVTRILEIQAPAPPPVQNPPPPPPPPPPSPPPPEEPPEDVRASLNDLGIATDDSPRISNEGVALPDSYSPFGTVINARIDADGNAHLGAPLELVLLGFSLDEENAFLTVIDDMPLLARTGAPPVLAEVLHKRSDTQAPWVRENRGNESAAPVTQRAAAVGDFDGDGIEELALARLQGGQVMVELKETADPNVAPVITVVPMPASLGAVNDLRIAAGDVDGDRKWELVLAASGPRVAGQRTRTSVLVLDDLDGGLAVLREIPFESTLNRVDVHVVLEPGNVDYDVQDEIVVVLNESDTNSQEPAQAATRMFVFDDAGRAFAQLLADTPTVVTSSASYVAQAADVAIGDFDDDDLNEIVAGGIAGMTVGNPVCNLDGSLRYVAVLYEFDGRSVARTSMSASKDSDLVYPSTCQDDGPWMMRFAFVNAVDLDGDLDHEFNVNQYVFSGFPAQDARWEQTSVARLPPTVLFPEGSSGALVFDRHIAALEAGDVNGDARDDLVSFRAGFPQLQVFSLTEEDGFYRSARLELEVADDVYGTPSGRAINPQLLPLNANIADEGEVRVLQFAGHFLDFTQPLVIAALAAPPCIEDVGQNLEACTTAWGRSESVSVEGEREIKFKAGISIGAKWEQSVPITGTQVAEFSIKGTLEREASRLKSESYEVTKTITFETGPVEDSVVFTSIPYDMYRYIEVASTSAEGPGMAYDIGLPREAAIRLATVRFYNAHTKAETLKIDEEVFRHRAGDIESYPTLAERDEILASRRTQLQALRTDCPFCWQADPERPVPFLDGPLRTFDPFAALPGLVSKVVGVGQGSGATEVGVELNVSNGVGRALETSIEFEVEWMAVPGKTRGFQLGGGVATSTTLTRSQGSSYVGTVGSIDAEHFIENKYRFGLFTYLQADPNSGLEFEVINYWVER